MCDQLLPEQEKVFQTIIKKLNHTNIIISGPSGCGKTKILNELYDVAAILGYRPLLLDSGKLQGGNAYAPFSLDQPADSLISDSSHASNIMETLHSWLQGRDGERLSFFNEAEREIFDKFVYLSKKQRLILLCDNV